MLIATLTLTAVICAILLVAGFFLYSVLARLAADRAEALKGLEVALVALDEAKKALAVLAARPRIVNLLQLGFKDARIKMTAGEIALPLDLPAFTVSKEKLLAGLRRAGERYKAVTTEPATRALCIIDGAGLDAILDSESRQSLKKALARVLINDDQATIEKFYEVLAESVAVGTALPAVEESK